MRKIGCPYSSSLARKNAASSSIVFRVKMTPVGLFGEFTMRAFVRSLTVSANASNRIWNFSVSAGTTLKTPPAASENTRYSGKNGAMAMNSEPGVESAFNVMVRDAAAPQVM